MAKLGVITVPVRSYRGDTNTEDMKATIVGCIGVVNGKMQSCTYPDYNLIHIPTGCIVYHLATKDAAIALATELNAATPDVACEFGKQAPQALLDAYRPIFEKARGW